LIAHCDKKNGWTKGSIRSFFLLGKRELSLLSRCFSSSFLSGSSLSLSGSGSGLLLSHLGGDSFVHFLLCLEFLGSEVLLGLSVLLTNSLEALLLCLFPSVELCLNGILAECALLHATTQVLHEVNAFLAQDVTYSVRGLSANLYPIECALKIQIYCGRIGVGVVSTNLLSKSTISWCTSVGDNDAVESISLMTATLQSDFCCHLFLFVKLGLNYATIS